MIRPSPLLASQRLRPLYGPGSISGSRIRPLGVQPVLTASYPGPSPTHAHSLTAGPSGAAVKFLQGDASNLPLESDSFDFIYCRAAFKNFRYPVKALVEMHRVLRLDGIAWIEDLRPDITEGEIA